MPNNTTNTTATPSYYTSNEFCAHGGMPIVCNGAYLINIIQDIVFRAIASIINWADNGIKSRIIALKIYILKKMQPGIEKRISEILGSDNGASRSGEIYNAKGARINELIDEIYGLALIEEGKYIRSKVSLEIEVLEKGLNTLY